MFRFTGIWLMLFLSSCTTTYYVVRHAEKETNTMTGDVPLSAAGKERAEALAVQLRHKNIQHIFSTPYTRTTATAKPLSEALGVPIAPYAVDTLDRFVNRLKAVKKGNVLVVGHSNTIDDTMNLLLGEKRFTDFPDSLYGVLYIIRRKGKNGFTVEESHFGSSSSTP